MFFNFTRILWLIIIIIGQSEPARCAPNQLDDGTRGNETKPEEEVREARKAAAEDGDVWSMVGSMRERSSGGGGGGEGRTDAVGTSFSKSFPLEWKIELDEAGNYRLNWCANVSRNEILFALDIDLAKSGFGLGRDIFALGFSERGQFASSDYCLIWFDLSHKIHLQDARTSANNSLELVESRDSLCKLLNHHHHSSPPDRESAGVEAESEYEDEEAKMALESGELRDSSEPASNREKLEIIFTRPLEVCDERSSKYYAIDNGTTHLVWFSLRGPLLALDRLNLSEALAGAGAGAGSSQERAGMRRVQLIASRAGREPRASGGSRVLELRMANYEVPARETTYMCKLFRLPAKFERRRYHITSYEAAIGPDGAHVVHHMELFNCANLDQTERNQLGQLAASGWTGECGSRERPAATQKCKRVILAWAMGARPLVYPARVGQSIGGRGYSPFVLLELHYNNVDSRSGLRDSSGLRFRYSAKLRPFDAGVLEVGLEYSDKNSIPPGVLAPLWGQCLGECTRAAMSAQPGPAEAGFTRSGKSRYGREDPADRRHDTQHGQARQTAEARLPGGIYIFAAQMHTHLTGVASWTEHVRGGQLLGELQRDDHYSPHFQEIRLLPEPVYLAPGDALIHYCLYDTRARRNITLGGFATTDEMCVTYLHYYPRIELEVCKSSVDSRALSGYFADLAREEAQQSTALAEPTAAERAGEGSRKQGALKTIGENYRSIEWSARRSRELIAFYQSAPLSVQCHRPDGRAWPGQWDGLEPAHFFALHPNYSAQIGLKGEEEVLGEREQRVAPFAGAQKGARELLQYRGFGGLARRRALCGRATSGHLQRREPIE